MGQLFTHFEAAAAVASTGAVPPCQTTEPGQVTSLPPEPSWVSNIVNEQALPEFTAANVNVTVA